MVILRRTCNRAFTLGWFHSSNEIPFFQTDQNKNPKSWVGVIHLITPFFLCYLFTNKKNQNDLRWGMAWWKWARNGLRCQPLRCQCLRCLRCQCLRCLRCRCLRCLQCLQCLQAWPVRGLWAWLSRHRCLWLEKSEGRKQTMGGKDQMENCSICFFCRKKYYGRKQFFGIFFFPEDFSCFFFFVSWIGMKIFLGHSVPL